MQKCIASCKKKTTCWASHLSVTHCIALPIVLFIGSNALRKRTSVSSVIIEWKIGLNEPLFVSFQINLKYFHQYHLYRLIDPISMVHINYNYAKWKWSRHTHELRETFYHDHFQKTFTICISTELNFSPCNLFKFMHRHWNILMTFPS